MKNTELVQTRISKKVFTFLRYRSSAEGISIAAYVRRLILRDWEKNGSN